MTLVEKLLALQEYDCQLRGMQREVHDIPLRKKMELARLNEHKQALVGANETLKQKAAELKRIELEAQSRQEKISKLRQQQMELKTNREFKAIESEISGIGEEIAALEDQQLGVMEEMDATRRSMGEREAKLKEEEASVQADIAVLDRRVSETEAEMKTVLAARTEAAGQVPPAWREPYERIFSRKDRAVVPIVDGVCGGCHMTLPRHIVNDSKKHDAMVSCGFCGRLVYS